MRHHRFYPSRQGNQIVWLGNFAHKLPEHASALGVTAGQVSAAVADCGWLGYILELWLPSLRAFEKACAAASREAHKGEGSGVSLPAFEAPALPDGVAPVAPGALDRIFALVHAIKNSGKCLDIIGPDLGIVGNAAAPPDLSEVGPVLVATVSGGAVHIKWGWRGWSAWLNGCEFVVDRSDGKGFGLLTVDTTPNFVDKHPWPAVKAVWTYKAIYRADDAQVGRWSAPVSVAVGG